MDHAQANPVSLRYGGDIRNLLMSSRTFIMQLAHPSVGAGVMQFSQFKQDPWSRLKEIAYSGNQMMFSGQDAAVTEGKRLRELHRNIKGIDSRGNKYHALNPQVYGWVHFVFYESTLATHKLFGNAINKNTQEILFNDWRESGQYFGLREKDLPETPQHYWEKWHDMMENTLEYNEAIDYIVNINQHTPPSPPQFTQLPKALWNNLWKPMGQHSHLMTVGSLPQSYRDKFSNKIPWDKKKQKKFNRQSKAIKTLFNFTPEDWHLMPEAKKALNSNPMLTVNVTHQT